MDESLSAVAEWFGSTEHYCNNDCNNKRNTHGVPLHGTNIVLVPQHMQTLPRSGYFCYHKLMLFFHIITALLSLLTASFTAYRPTKGKLILTYFMTAGTLITGVSLMALESVAFARVCISGGVYLVGVISLILIARRKMAAALLY